MADPTGDDAQQKEHVKLALVAYATAPLGALKGLRKPVLCSRCTKAIGVCGCYEERLNRELRAADG
jgi:hypothetical protein